MAVIGIRSNSYELILSQSRTPTVADSAFKEGLISEKKVVTSVARPAASAETAQAYKTSPVSSSVILSPVASISRISVTLDGKSHCHQLQPENLAEQEFQEVLALHLIRCRT